MKEQVNFANELVDYSIQNHPIEDIFANVSNWKERQREFRFTDTLGEIVFADNYVLTRPISLFVAIDRQDFS